MTHDHRLEGAEGLLSTYRHHRHRKLRLFENLVVLRILRESGKLREPGPHSARLRVSDGKEISGGFVGLTRIGGKIIPYYFLVSTVPGRHLPLRIRAMGDEVSDPGNLGELGPT